MHQVIADDSKSHLSLKKMTEQAKQDSVIFQSLTEPLLDGQIDIQSEWPDLNAILIFVTMGTTIASTLLMLWTFFKIRKLSTALLILQQTKVVKSLATDMPSFVYKSPTKPSAPPTIFQFDFDLAWDHVIFILCLLNFACSLLNAYCMVHKFKRINASVLKLEVTSGNSCVLLLVLKLPLCPVFCHIEMPHDVANLSVHGPWHSKNYI